MNISLSIGFNMNIHTELEKVKLCIIIMAQRLPNFDQMIVFNSQLCWADLLIKEDKLHFSLGIITIYLIIPFFIGKQTEGPRNIRMLTNQISSVCIPYLTYRYQPTIYCLF